MPTARGEPTLSSTWYCAGGTGGQGSRADHGLIIANPTDRARKATVTALTGDIAPSPELVDPETGEVDRTEAHTAGLQSLMRRSYAVFCLKTQKQRTKKDNRK